MTTNFDIEFLRYDILCLLIVFVYFDCV